MSSERLREAVERLADERSESGFMTFGGKVADAVIWPDELRSLLDAYPAAPTEEVQGPRRLCEPDEERTVVISPIEWADLLAEAWEKGASFVASSPTGLDRKTWANPYREPR